MVICNKWAVGDHVWVLLQNREPFETAFAGRILTLEPKRIKVEDDSGRQLFVTHSEVLKPMHYTSLNNVADMINLGDLQEYSILRNLQKRYHQNLIYTYTGSILVAINPYKHLPIYTDEYVRRYHHRQLSDLPPHIFAIAESSYKSMTSTNQSQCILISGESGAGKTESTKLILQYLATISGKRSWIEEQILQSNPLLEAFGNSKTASNDNSSRFGRYMNVFFNINGDISCAKIEQYLLEKSRIVSQNEGERNYNIFYSLLSGLNQEDKNKLHLSNFNEYNYLISGRTLTSHKDETNEFIAIRTAMEVLNFSNSETWDIFQGLASVLHLGNLNFTSANIENIDCATILKSDVLRTVASLIEIKELYLVEAFTKKRIYAQGDTVISHLNLQQAKANCDAFSKALYGKIFDYIIDKLNSVIFNTKEETSGCVGVLDVFGFENYQNNGFEQLCINYANEKLQQLFVKHIFKLEQQYYTAEGIEWKYIPYTDNQIILDLLAAKSMSIMSLIDEESKFPKGTDHSMLSKLHKAHTCKRMYRKPKSDTTAAFGIEHFAGTVFYNTHGFLEKNRDAFSPDLQQIIKYTTSHFLKRIFRTELMDVNAKKTICSQFKSSLSGLMEGLSSCQPYFIRCLKPNQYKLPQEFDRNLCCRQLRYSGLMETAKIRKAGYPVRYPYTKFVKRYHILVKDLRLSTVKNFKHTAELMCNHIFSDRTLYQFGHTQLFLKDFQSEFLETQRNKTLISSVILIQKVIRGWICRQTYKKIKHASVTIQKYYRSWSSRQKFLLMKIGYLRLQASIAAKVQKNSYNKLRKTTIELQAYCKGYLVRNWSNKKLLYLRSTNITELSISDSAKHNPNASSLEQLEYNQMVMSEHNQKTVDVEQTEKILDNIFEFLNTCDKRDEEFVFLQPNVEASTGCSFKNFATTFFYKDNDMYHSTKDLIHPLLEPRTPDDSIAALAIWNTLLWFLGDKSEPLENKNNSIENGIMFNLNEIVKRGFDNREEFKQLVQRESDISRFTKENKNLNFISFMEKKKQMFEDVRNGLLSDNFINNYYAEWLNYNSSSLEKVHFIIGHGILREDLRDEIYCQICKQLTQNSSNSSFSYGWLLLSLCVGCFPPSEHFLIYLLSFIHDGPPEYSAYCDGRLNQTLKNGVRIQPPGYLELQATRNKSPLKIQVGLMNDKSISIDIDSASTAKEVCRYISTALNLKDSFGFSLSITHLDRVTCLGNDNYHIMDAISQCEQEALKQGKLETISSWRLFYIKEIFTPWYNSIEDPMATNLIYHQIIRGLQYEEYRCSNYSDLADLIAQQYYIENGNQMDQKILRRKLTNYVPNSAFNSQNSLKDWVKKITDAFSKSNLIKHKATTIKSKAYIVNYAKTVWPILFSKLFKVRQISGPRLLMNDLVLAVNCNGIFLIANEETILLELTFCEITHVGYEKTDQKSIFILYAVQYEMAFECSAAESLYKLTLYLLDGLKQRSLYAIALESFKPENVKCNMLSLNKGDMIQLSETLGFGECNGRKGEVPLDKLYILPTITKPSDQILKLIGSSKLLIPHNLSEYAKNHFTKTNMWKYSKGSIETPLLKSIQGDRNHRDACQIFSLILKYMKDGKNVNDIFTIVLNNNLLKDEFYCQIIKQLTCNNELQSTERAWELMYLAIGLFTSELNNELFKFLKSNSNPLAGKCLERLERTKICGPRKFPPYDLEIKAIQERKLKIHQRIYLPDGSYQDIEIHSTDKVMDFCSAIADKLNLLTNKGFGLYILIFDRTIAIPNNEIFYDFLYRVRSSEKLNSCDNSDIIFQIFFLKKVWLDTVPRNDLKADCILHYHQELINYLKGYHYRCTNQNQKIVELASLICRVKYLDNRRDFPTITDQMLYNLVPKNLINTINLSELKTKVTNKMSKVIGLSIEEARFKFLDDICEWPTFGSSFFEVMQTSNSTLSTNILLCINKWGVHIIDDEAKGIVETYQFSDLSHWSSGTTFFVLHAGSKRRLFETSQGPDIEDLITSYKEFRTDH